MKEKGSIKIILIAAALAVIVGFTAAAIFLKPKTAPEQKENIPYANDRISLPSPDSSTNAIIKNVETNNKKTMNTITLETNMGNIVFETYNNDAPKTVENFVTLAKKGFYDGLIFHRVIDGFMIQGGDPTGTGMSGPGYKFADELDPSTPSYKAGYQKGVVAMANSGPNTNGSQFFIMLQDNPLLPNLYTIFGKVISGQDVVDAIGKVKTNSDDRPLTPVVIKKAIVSE